MHLSVELTLYDVNDAQTKQGWYMIGSGSVNCNGPSHAVSNKHDWRWVVSIKCLHHFANIPLGKKKKKKQEYNLSACFSVMIETLIRKLVTTFYILHRNQ